jgi:hypothetical protein
LDLCFFVVVVVVVVVVVGLVVVVVVDEPPFLPPHPATATVLARTATSVRMAVSGVLLMGRAPVIARGLGGSPYQVSAASIAVARQRKRRPEAGCATL